MIVGKWHKHAAGLTGAALLFIAGFRLRGRADSAGSHARRVALPGCKRSSWRRESTRRPVRCSAEKRRRLDPAGGTLLNLASCHASAGMTATAWGEFSEALAEARRVGRADCVKAAEVQIAALEPRLARMTVAVNSDGTALAGVELDARPLPSVSWGRPFPVDPGRHVLKEHAPGHLPYETTVEVGVEQKAVTLPPLVAEVVAAAPVVAPPPPAPVVSSNPTQLHPPALITDDFPLASPRGRLVSSVSASGATWPSTPSLSARTATPGARLAAPRPPSPRTDTLARRRTSRTWDSVSVSRARWPAAHLIVTSRREVSSPAMRAAMALLPQMTAGPRGAVVDWAASF